MSQRCTSRPVALERGAAAWPAGLDHIEAPPLCLWALGRLDLLSRGPRVAIVGTRAPTAYGEHQARRFARRLALAGAVVVSGLARGVDSAAHEAVLDAGGATLGVLGSGVDRPWPDGALAQRMRRDGLLLSELAPGTAPRRHHFPRRNRLISGLADAVVVIEAASASGSLITARWATDQGRAVFALPGRVDHPMARGCHRLLREGAQLVEDPEEVAAELGLDAAPSHPGAAAGPDPPAARRDGLPRRLFALLAGETLSAEELALRVEREIGEVLTALVELELAGALVRASGGLYRRA